MGRTIPTDENDLLIPPVLSFSLFAAGMAAATFAMITALCSFRRKAQRNVNHEDILQSPDVLKTKEEGVADVKTREEPAAAMSNETIAPQEPETEDIQEDEDGDDLKNKELPLPPGMKTSGIGAQAVNSWNASNANTTTSQMKKSASDRRLLSSLSLKLPRSLSMARRGEKSKDEANFNKRKNNNGRKLSMSSVTSMASMTKQEESIWMKTIILGEKNRVPDEDDDAAMIYDSKGRRIPAYHPKSRQNSFIDQRALPSQIRSRQCSFIDPSAIPDQRSSNATRDGDHREMISEDEQELMSLSQL